MLMPFTLHVLPQIELMMAEAYQLNNTQATLKGPLICEPFSCEHSQQEKLNSENKCPWD